MTDLLEAIKCFIQDLETKQKAAGSVPNAVPLFGPNGLFSAPGQTKPKRKRTRTTKHGDHDQSSHGGGGSGSKEAALEKLAKIPAAREDQQWFGGKHGEEIYYKDAGFVKGTGGVGSWPNERSKVWTTAKIDPSKIGFNQLSVTRSLVAMKINGESWDEDDDQGLPILSFDKEAGIYNVEEGHHRATAAALLNGEVEARVFGWDPKTDKYYKVTP